MARRSSSSAAVVAFVDAPELPTLAEVCEALPDVDAEVAADIVKSGSVVRSNYKKLYAARASEAGLGKVAQRSCWDWLAQQLAGEALVDGKLHEERFRALLDANGVRNEHWGTGDKRTKGWEGRLRMTGRLALQRVVAKQGHLKTPDGEELVAPADWIAKHTH